MTKRKKNAAQQGKGRLGHSLDAEAKRRRMDDPRDDSLDDSMDDSRDEYIPPPSVRRVQATTDRPSTRVTNASSFQLAIGYRMARGEPLFMRLAPTNPSLEDGRR